MLNKLVAFIRKYDMLQPGDRVVCAVSGGADSIALLFALYLLQSKLRIEVSAAHFNHGLRGTESDRDEAFVHALCERFDIPLAVGRGQVSPGKKGLEAAARDARYNFLKSLPGKIATAHTANDNAETMLMHLVRGTGLKGLGAIAPVNGVLIRPMLDITRREVEDFLREYHLEYVTDSTNDTDLFLRNRLRHHVMPFLEKENPRIYQNMSALAQRLHEDEAALAKLASLDALPPVDILKQMSRPVRYRTIAAFLQRSGVPEPEAEHIAFVDRLIHSDNPSARANLPGNITIAREYNTLRALKDNTPLETVHLVSPCVVDLPELGLRVCCLPASEAVDRLDAFTVHPRGDIVLRARKAKDMIRLCGGSRELKKLFIDRKIPAAQRLRIPVIADDEGVLGIYGIGVNMDRYADTMPAIEIRFEKLEINRKRGGKK